MIFGMVFGPTRRGDAERLERIEATVQRMFVDDRHALDLAMSALVGGAAPGTVGDDLRTTDTRVNEAEREVRRELVVDVSVHGGVDVPEIQIDMSIVKDIERIGDYAKNLYDIAQDDVDQRVSELVTGRVGEPYALAYALTYRYFERIVAHLRTCDRPWSCRSTGSTTSTRTPRTAPDGRMPSGVE